MKKVVKFNDSPTVYGTGLVALDIVISANADEGAYQWAGGTCGNVLTILSYLNWDAFPIARLNEETSSLRVKSDMKKWGVRLDFSELAPTASVPVITQEISKDDQGNSVHKFHWKNCPKCGSWLPNYKPVTLKGTQAVKDQAQKGEVFFFDRTSPGALDLARHFKSLGCIIFFEPSAKGDPRHFAEAIKLADIIKYSSQRFSSVISQSPKKARPLLEIQTLGSEGLRYRSASRKSWHHLSAFEAEEVVDTCGCGDWTTAGIISQLCNEGLQGLIDSSCERIESALRYGQALGAWNCCFEGARGGMYRINKHAFEKDIDSILRDGSLRVRSKSRKPHSKHASDGLCPACPTH